MGETRIEWADFTFNPWIGCAKVSAGCAHCYAERENARRQWAPEGWGFGKPRRRTSDGNWEGPRLWEKQFGGHAYRPRVFCASLADWLDPEIDPQWLADLLDLIYATTGLDWMLLSKRPRLWRGRLEAAMPLAKERENIGLWLRGAAPAGVWIGTSVEDQLTANFRIPYLLRIPARVRFLSCEPLIGPVSLGSLYDLSRNLNYSALRPGFFEPQKVDWVICGGESGPEARVMDREWVWAVRDACVGAGVPFFFKQWGEYDEFGERIGKKAAGRLLDGRQWNEFPAREGVLL
jgi:protein gp37